MAMMEKREMMQLLRTVLSGFLCVITLSFLMGCKDEENTVNCPTIDDNITWSPNGTYGELQFGKAGGDDAAREIAEQCGWRIVSAGGVGRTFTIATQNNEIQLVWIGLDFEAFIVSDGWKGKTERGVRMGASQDTVLAAYPEFQRVGSEYELKVECTTGSGIGVKAIATFSNGQLTRLFVIGRCS